MIVPRTNGVKKNLNKTYLQWKSRFESNSNDGDSNGICLAGGWQHGVLGVLSVAKVASALANQWQNAFMAGFLVQVFFQPRIRGCLLGWKEVMKESKQLEVGFCRDWKSVMSW